MTLDQCRTRDEFDLYGNRVFQQLAMTVGRLEGRIARLEALVPAQPTEPLVWPPIDLGPVEGTKC